MILTKKLKAVMFVLSGSWSDVVSWIGPVTKNALISSSDENKIIMKMSLQIMGKVSVLLCLLLSNSDCKVTGTDSTTIPPSTSTAHSHLYPGCGVKLDREYNTSGIWGSIVGGTEVTEDAFPWMAFIYNYDREELWMDLDLDDGNVAL